MRKLCRYLTQTEQFQLTEQTDGHGKERAVGAILAVISVRGTTHAATDFLPCFSVCSVG